MAAFGLTFKQRGKTYDISLRELSVATLLEIHQPEDPAGRQRSIAFLHYCDGDLLKSERALSRLGEDDPVAKFLRKKVEEAFPHLYRVTTPEEKAALRE